MRERERERGYDTVINAKLGTCFPIRRKCKKKEENIRQEFKHLPDDLNGFEGFSEGASSPS